MIRPLELFPNLQLPTDQAVRLPRFVIRYRLGIVVQDASLDSTIVALVFVDSSPFKPRPEGCDVSELVSTINVSKLLNGEGKRVPTDKQLKLTLQAIDDIQSAIHHMEKLAFCTIHAD
ncbi:hypothetical protein Aduo_002182 [Ancylostoma duodenale]